MSDIRIDKLAQTLVEYSVAVRPGDRVVINGSTVAEPLLLALYSRVLQAGGYPLMLLTLPGTDELFYRYASDDQLKYVAKPAELIMETYDARISVLAEANTRALSNVDPAKTVMRRQAQAGIMRTFMRRSAAGELRWTVAPFPTNALAQDAEMSLNEYEDFVYGACLPDLSDPVGCWRRVSARQQRIIDWLAGKSRVHVAGKETDLRLSIAGRRFINCNGCHNMPDGEVYTGPAEDSVEGHVLFSYPAIYGGREVTGVRLTFEHGRVVEATAEKNEDYLVQTLDTDAGSRYVGEFAIGTNAGIDRFTREILFDEKMGGTFHMAMGAGYPETGSKNESAIHWDMICDLREAGQIWVDDELIYENGRFLLSCWDE